MLVSNHCSFVDAAILVHSVRKPLRLVCHYYMSKAPLLKNVVSWLGCFSLAEGRSRLSDYCQEEIMKLLQSEKMSKENEE